MAAAWARHRTRYLTKHANRTLELLNADPLSAVTYNKAICDCSKVESLWYRALEMFDKMEEAVGVVPDINSHNRIIEAETRFGCPRRALQLFEDMQSREMNLDADTYKIALHACGKLGQVNRQMQLLSEMELFGLQPNNRHFTAIIRSFMEVGRPDHVLQLFIEMERHRVIPDKRTLLEAS